MYLLSSLGKVLVLVFLFATMLSIGLTTGRAQLRSLVGARSLVVRMLVANFVIVPLLGFALSRLVPLPRESAGALILLACVPGGLSSIQYTSKIKGEKLLAGAILVLLNLLAVLVSPVLLRMTLPAGVEHTLPHVRVFGFIGLGILIPAGIGMFLGDKAPGVAPRLSKGLGFVSLLAFVAFVLVTKSFRKEALASIGGLAAGVLLLFILASMLIGWLMGGPTREKRQLLATVTSMRGAALCLAIANATPSGAAVVTPLVAFSLLMVTPNTLLTVYSAIRARIAAGRLKKSQRGKDS